MSVAALGDAAHHDPFWGVRVEALSALGRIGGAASEKQILAAVNDDKPWVRDVAVQQLGRFKEDRSLSRSSRKLPRTIKRIASAPRH